MTTECRMCGVEFQPSHADYVGGRWRVCPDCRAAPVVPEALDVVANRERARRRAIKREAAGLDSHAVFHPDGGQRAGRSAVRATLRSLGPDLDHDDAA